MNASIWQIQYDDDVLGSFDPHFLKYDCRDRPEAEKREIAHMLRFYDEGVAGSRGAVYYGLVSPKFTEKTGISGKDFVAWIDANPGYDVYFINPFPQLAYWNFNVWTQGERWHPKLIVLADKLLATAGHPIRINHLSRNTNDTAAYSNYWVGNKRFWDAYMTFVRSLDGAVDNLSRKNRSAIFSVAPHYAKASYFPFVFERLFSTFLLLRNDIRFLSYPYETKAIYNKCQIEMERLIIREWGERIDAWDHAQRGGDDYKGFFADLSRALQCYESIHFE